ncbi:NUDIX hydrolase [Pararhodospirillum oryzae]|nr:NUDIX hydrolase [Pararhodospirillum oryzae]
MSADDSPSCTPPRVGVLAVVWRDGQVLLVRRCNPPQAGRWGFPGGRVEPGETLAHAAERELVEETRVRGRAVDILPVIEHIGEGQHWILVPVACAWMGEQPRPASDVDQAGWFEPDALPRPLCEGMERLVCESLPTVGGPTY